MSHTGFNRESEGQREHMCSSYISNTAIFPRTLMPDISENHTTSNPLSRMPGSPSMISNDWKNELLLLHPESDGQLTS